MTFKSIGKVVAAACLLLSSSAWADPMAVKDGVVFVLAGGRLMAYPVLPGGVLPSGCRSALVSTRATDVLVSRGRAILRPGTGNAVFDSVDVSACLSGSDSPDNTAVNLKKGSLEIMCARIDDGRTRRYYHVIMKQRGKSSNWEVTFASPSPFCGRLDD